MADDRRPARVTPEERQRWEALTLAWVKGLHKLTPEQRERVLEIDRERVARGELPWLEHIGMGDLRAESERDPGEGE